MTAIVVGFDAAGRRVLEIGASAEGPRLIRPANGTALGMARLVLPDAHVPGTKPQRSLVLDLAPRQENLANHFNKVTITSTAAPSGPRLVSALEFQGKVRCLLGVDRSLHVHGRLAADGTTMRWTQLGFHAANGQQPLQQFQVDETFLGQPSTRMRAAVTNPPLWERLGLHHAVGLDEVHLEIVPAPLTAPLDYTGENLSEQLVSSPPDDGPLVVRMRQHCHLAADMSHRLVVEQFRVDIDALSLWRAGLNRTESNWGIRCVQTQDVLGPDGTLSTEIGRWIWRVEGIPMVPMLRAYGQAARRYLSSLQTVQDGRPISGVPLLDERFWDRPPNVVFPQAGPDAISLDSEREFARRWNISLNVIDRLDENDSLADTSLFGRWPLQFRAAFPLDPYRTDENAIPFKYRCSLPGLSRHDFYCAREDASPAAGVVNIDCTLDPIEQQQERELAAGSTDREGRLHQGRQDALYDSIWRGFVFRLQRWYRKGTLGQSVANRDAPVPLQLVRVGALDLGFSGPLDAVDPALFFNPGSVSSEQALKGLVDRGERDDTSLESRRWSVITLGWRDPRGGWSVDLPTVAMEWLLRVDSVVPGGQDGLPDEPFNPVDVRSEVERDVLDRTRSAVRERFLREPALLITVPTEGASERTGPTPFLLRLREHTSPMQSQLVAMNLFEWGSRERSEGNREPMRLVVIDRHPFLVAHVHAPPLTGIGGADGNLEVGNWSLAGFEGASWELAGASEGFTLSFPPQAVGEAMEKRTVEEAPLPGHESEPRPGRDILEGQAAQFRLSPTAVFELRSSYFRQNFTEAAWNLRRILGYPGQRAPGAGVHRLQFELLYGMQCEVRHDDLRLAELSSRLGAVPKALPQQISRVLGRDRLGKNLDYLPALELVFRQLNYRWSRQFQAYLSRLGVFEPWLRFTEAGVTLKSNVQYELRDPQRIMQDPASLSPSLIHDPASLSPSQFHEPSQPFELLAGGALWGFDFVSQYQPFRDSATTRRSTSGELSRPAFSALGGWGHQKAVFQNGLTTIYSDTAMGRTFFYSVERRGRIGGFWNFAKHVVIYERTVGTAKQFRPVRNAARAIVEPNQDHLAGRPVLRKVQEYVEILQPRRGYPDLGGEAVARGCVQSIEFSRTIIPVDYRWGRDIVHYQEDGSEVPIGYVIPLWRPDADPVIYPKPQVTLRLAGAAAAGDSHGCELVDPQKLLFYSQADSPGNEEVNTDTWKAVRGVDFPDSAWPVAPPVKAPTNGSLEQTLPDEVAVAPGYEGFTFNILSAKPVDVVANRSDKATAAMIRNVSMVRADPITGHPLSKDAAAATAVVASQETMNDVQSQFKRLLALSDGDLSSAAVRTEIKQLAQAASDGVANVLKTQLVEVFQAKEGVLRKPRDWERLTKGASRRWAESAGPAIESEFNNRFQARLDDLSGNLNEAKAQAKRWLRESWDVFRIAAPAVDPGIEEIQHGLTHAIDRVAGIPQRLKAIIAEKVSALEQQLDYPLLDIVPPEGDQQALAELAHRAQREIVTVIRQIIEQATDGLGPHLRRGILEGCRLLIPVADEELTRWRRALLSDLLRPADELLDDVYDIYAWLDAFTLRLGSTTDPGNQLLFSSSDNVAAQVAALDAQTVAAETAAAFESNRLTLTAVPVVTVQTAGTSWTIENAGVTFTLALDAAVVNVYATPLAEAIKVRRDLSSALTALLDLNVNDETGALIATFGELVQNSQLLNTCLAAIEAAGSPENIRAAAAGLIAKLAKGAEKLPGFATAANLATFLDRFEAPALKSKLLGVIAGVDSPITPLSPGGLKQQLEQAIQGLAAADIQAIFDGSGSDLDRLRRELQSRLGGVQSGVAGMLNGLAQPLAARFPSGAVQQAGTMLRLVRAFGDAPLVQGMGFSRARLGYFYHPLKSIKGLPVDISPTVALVNRVGGHLKAMGVNLPTGQILDQVLPPADQLMKQIDFGRLLPDFAGVKLDKLLPELKSPEGLKDKVKITQNFDRQAGRGWVQADVRVPVSGPSTLFDAGALKVSLRDVLFTAQIRIEAGVSGAPTHRQSGNLTATWDLTLGGTPLISFIDTSLTFDESGKTKFSLDPTKIRMNGVLSMLSDVMKSVSTGGNGFTLRLREDKGLPIGVEALLRLPLPDIAFGVCALANLRFGVQFEIVALPEFAIGLSVNVSEKATPFTLTIFILGGGGWFVARGRYLPLSNRLTTSVSIGLSAGAMLAIAFGPAKGCVFAFFFVEGELQTDSDSPGSRQLIIRIGLILGGEVDVCGLISVSIRLLLEMEYDGSALTGRGTLSIRVKVCFFLTISFSRTVEKRLAGQGRRDSASTQTRVENSCNDHLDRTAA